MSIPKCKDFSNYNKYPSDANPTSNAQMQEYMQNQNDLVKHLASMMWQPQTQYTVGQFVFSSALPSGAFAVCTTAGTTGVTEPTWSAIGSNTSDSGVTWSVRRLENKPFILKVNGISQPAYNGDDAKTVDLQIVKSVNGVAPDGNGVVNVSGISVGMIIPYIGNATLPAGFLLCNGSSVSKTTYSALFDVIGYTFGGSGDNFNLPNLNERFLEGGETAGQYKDAGLPNIEGEWIPGVRNPSNARISGVFEEIQSMNKVTSWSSSSSNNTHGFSFDASRSSSVYGNSDTVQPKSLTVRYIIKAFDGASANTTDLNITNLANDVIAIQNSYVRSVNGVTADDNGNVTISISSGGSGGTVLPNGTCTTAETTSAKVVTVNGNFSLVVGQMILVKFTNSVMIGSTLNVNNTGAKTMKCFTSTGGNYPTTNFANISNANNVLNNYGLFYYNGTYWVLVTHIAYNN